MDHLKHFALTFFTNAQVIPKRAYKTLPMM